MEKRVTIKDIARECGVSVTTVSMALRGFEAIPLETRNFIRDTAIKLRYRPNYHARHLPNHTTSAVTIVFQALEEPFYDPFFMRVLAGVYSKAHEMKFKVQLEFADDEFFSRDPELMVQSNETLGFIIFASCREYIEKWEKINTNAVLICDDSNIIPALNADEEDGAYMITKHLLTSHNARNFTYVRGSLDITSTKKRLNGFLKAINEFDAVCESIIDAGFSTETAYTIADRINTEFVVCANDLMAAGVKLKRPELKITGMDNSPVSKYLQISTVNIPLEEMGKKAIELLKSKQKSVATFKTQTIIRNSCGCKNEL